MTLNNFEIIQKLHKREVTFLDDLLAVVHVVFGKTPYYLVLPSYSQ